MLGEVTHKDVDEEMVHFIGIWFPPVIAPTTLEYYVDRGITSADWFVSRGRVEATLCRNAISIERVRGEECIYPSLRLMNPSHVSA